MSSFLLLSTVILDPPSALLAGSVVALISFKLVVQKPEREVLRTGAYGALWGLLYGIAVGLPFFRYPDWMLVYLRDSSGTSLVLLYVLFVVTLVASGAAGGLGTAALVAQKKTALAVALCVGALATLGGAALLTSPQYSVVGTYAEYVAGKAVPLASSALPTTMGITSAIAVVGSLAMLAVRIREVLKKPA